MELKYSTPFRFSSSALGSNRTFMELKSPSSIDAHLDGASSNRTFMELKYEFYLSVTNGEHTF